MSLSLQSEQFRSFLSLAMAATGCQWALVAIGAAGGEPALRLYSTDDMTVRQALQSLGQCNETDTWSVASLAEAKLEPQLRKLCEAAGIGAWLERRKRVLAGGQPILVAVAVAHPGPIARDAHADRVLDLLADQLCEHVKLSVQVKELADRRACVPPGAELPNDTARAQHQNAGDSLFRLLFESAPALYLVVSLAPHRILAASDLYLETAMLRRECIVGALLFDVFPDDPDDARAGGVAALSASLARVEKTKAPDVMAIQRYPIRQGDGFVLKYWSSINFPVFSADREVSMIIHRVQDVTDYVLARQAEGSEVECLPLHPAAQQETEIVLRSQEMKRLAESLAESEQRLRLQAEMLDNANDAILVRDLQNRILYWNRAAEVRYGWAAHEVIGRLATDTVYANSPSPEFDNAMQSLFRFGDFTGRMVHSRRDGSRFVVHAHWILVRNADATPRAILSVVTDLTAQIALEQRLLQAQKLESLGQITGGIAHDFNNWLTVIIGNAEELAESLADRPDLSELAGMIQTAGERGAGLTRRLLAFARQQPLEPELLDVSALVGDMEPLIRRSIAKDVDLRVSLPGQVWYVSVDRAQLENAILNLCINANDAMPQGGTLTITVANEQSSDAGAERTERPADLVVISVADTGHGVPKDLQDRIFEPFFTTKKAGSGSGLGLSMAYGFARQSHGNLTLHSEPGAGATVRLHLPRSYAEPGDRAGTVTDVTATADSASRVLMVEDDPLVHVVTCHQLMALGYAVVQASSGAEALDLLDRGVACDVLFTDVVMPGMTGMELAERAIALRPGLPVLLTSGYTYAAMRHHGRLDSRFPLLHKPYSRNTLAAALSDALNLAERAKCNGGKAGSAGQVDAP